MGVLRRALYEQANALDVLESTDGLYKQAQDVMNGPQSYRALMNCCTEKEENHDSVYLLCISIVH